MTADGGGAGRLLGGAARWLAPVAALAYGLLVVVAMVRWAGLPRVDPTLFVVGAVAMGAAVAGVGLAAWYLFRSTAVARAVGTAPTLAVHERRWLASVLALAGVLIVVGGFWDEVWHRDHGIPFGADLFWRPHLLMYVGLASVMAAAAGGAWRLWRRGTGDIRARLRSSPTLGWLVLLGAFLAYALPADPAWHMLYGADITAWSIPHLVLLISISAIMLTAAGVQLSSEGRATWRQPGRAGASALLACLAIALALLLSLQVLTMEWDGITRIRRGSPHPFWQRPEWLLPTVVAGAAAFFGTLALRATRVLGAATSVGLLALGVRAALVGAFDPPHMSVHAWLLVLPPLVALDVAFALRVTRGRPEPHAGVAGLAVGLGLTGGTLPLIGALYLYPQVTLGTAPTMVLFGLVTAVWAAYLGARLGAVLEPGATAAGPTDGRWVRVPAIGLLATTAFLVWFVATATPPA